MNSEELLSQQVFLITDYKCNPGAPRDGFLLNALNTLFRLSRVLLDLLKYILIGAIKLISVRSS